MNERCVETSFLADVGKQSSCRKGTGVVIGVPQAQKQFHVHSLIFPNYKIDGKMKVSTDLSTGPILRCESDVLLQAGLI